MGLGGQGLGLGFRVLGFSVWGLGSMRVVEPCVWGLGSSLCGPPRAHAAAANKHRGPNLLGKELQFGNFLLVKFTTQHDLH